MSSFTLISFSGVDGAGKSTQIDALCNYLREAGRSFVIYKFWDDIVVLSRFREHMSLKAFKGDKGIGSPEKPILRRDKNVRSWYMTAFRLGLYILDALHLRTMVAKSSTLRVDCVIFDRYIYDEIANLPLEHAMVKLYVKVLLRLIPRQNVALILDAEPEQAALRKPEYPLEFVRENRQAYLALAGMIQATIIPPSSIEEASERIALAVEQAHARSHSTQSRPQSEGLGRVPEM